MLKNKSQHTGSLPPLLEGAWGGSSFAPSVEGTGEASEE
jgi:hypothetical protein